MTLSKRTFLLGALTLMVRPPSLPREPEHAILVSRIREVLPEQIAWEICRVQPMHLPVCPPRGFTLVFKGR